MAAPPMPIPPIPSGALLNSSSGSGAPVPTLQTKRKVVLPEGLAGHHSIPHHGDPWHQWEGFVVILVLLHIAVLAFYSYVLYRERRDKRERRRVAGGSSVIKGEGIRGTSGAAKAVSSPLSGWRTPKDILEKQRLGKA